MIKRFLALFLCAIILLPLLSACGKDSDVPEGMQSVTLEGEPFIFYVPEEWTDNRDSGISSAYYSIEKSILASARYYACDEETQSAGLLAYVENIAAQNAIALNNYEKVGDIKEASLSGPDAKRYEYTYSYRGNKTTVIQYYKFHGEDVVVLSLYIATEHYTEEYSEMFEKIRSNFVLCAKGDVKNDEVVDKHTPEGMKKASDDDVQYACYVPKSWITDLSDKLTYAYYPESGKPNVTVTSFSPNEDITAEQYFKECEMEYKENFKEGYELIGEPKSRTVAERSALSYEYKVIYGGAEYKIMQTVFIYNGLAYSITYTARLDAYDAHLDDVEAILSHFRFR
ncbi:MAG: hypothetical protein E7678_00115 [Ruminococcaceae bacterium]|nr:hypothetical protein [Oscillospiraceae bacterium]